MLLLVGIFTLGQLSQFACAATDPEAFMSAVEMIRYWGYPAEYHDVQTADGYILSLFRIPHGRNSEANSSCHRPAVLFAHGFGGGSPEFFMNPPASAPAMILADAGFDVYLLNFRGTTYCKRHTTLKPWDNKFWQFTVDELAKYDAPVVIDKVLELSGQSGVYWIGHSMGTSIGYLTLAENPTYNSKVKALFQMAPSGASFHSKGLIRLAFLAYNTFKPVVDFYRVAFGSHEVAWQMNFIARTGAQLFRPLYLLPFVDQLTNIITAPLLGPSTRTFNLSRAPVYSSHAPSGTSTWNALHLVQIATRGKIERMDHNPLENIQRYGQDTPTPYDYNNIDVPVYLISSKDDWLATPEDIEAVVQMMKPGLVKGRIVIEGYNHIDFALAEDCGEQVFKPITEIVRRQEKEMYASCHRPAVLFAHGFGGGSTEFYMNPPESSPAFIMADSGFDVYLLNIRGTTYSKRHITLNPWDNKFWQFTVDEITKYDATAAIDKALGLSGNSGVYWIGHSMGTTIGYLTLADHTEYNSKVKALFQMAPSGLSRSSKGPIQLAFIAYNTFKPIVDFYRVALGSHEVAFQLSFIYRPLVQLCTLIPFGPQTRAPVYLAHTPSGTSTWNALHLAQIATRGKFEHMDHNPLENIQRYGQETPIPYDLSNINVPVYHFSSASDYLATAEDIAHTTSLMRERTVKGSFVIPGYNHIDFAVAADCADQVFKPITEIVRREEKEMCER